MTGPLTGVVARYLDAWNDHDPDACVACFAPDGVRAWQVQPPPHIGDEPLPRFTGRRAIRERVAALMDTVDDLQIEVTSLSEGSDGRVWVEWRYTGTHVGDWGEWPAHGEPLDVVGVSIFRIEGGLISEERVYWDTMLMAGAALVRSAG